MATEQWWRARARDGIRDLLGAHGALLKIEVEARLSDQRYLKIGHPLDPHHLSAALVLLEAEGELQPATRRTRGRVGPVTVYQDTNDRLRRDFIARAAQRRRLLYSRWWGWTQPSAQFPKGRFGPAGEAANHATLTAVAPRIGLTMLNPDGAEVTSIMGRPVRGGPLDHGGWVTTRTPAGVPQGLILALIEVKNVRQHLYPDDPRIFQVLHKAGLAVQDHGNELAAVPVLVCRRRQFLTYTMARDLGLYVIETTRSYMDVTGVEPGRLEQVRSELNMRFLHPEATADLNLAEQWEKLSTRGAEVADRWHTVGRHLTEHYAALRDEQLDPDDRAAAMNRLREDARKLGCNGPWTKHNPRWA